MAETGTQNITEVTEASSIATGDNIYLNHSNQLQQIDYDKLATAILNKLSTQSFSSLETTAKTVLGGINELNSKSIFNTVGTNILQNENINNYTNPGTYVCQDASVASTLSGIPSYLNVGFRLDVIRKTNGRSMQIIFPNEPDIFYIRGFIRDNSSFGSWKKFSGDDS